MSNENGDTKHIFVLEQINWQVDENSTWRTDL
jgi:hypothetical protein